MKATGIVRRVDDLGRIVIPKEIRRTLLIKEGDLLLKPPLWAMKTLYHRAAVHLFSQLIIKASPAAMGSQGKK